MRLRSPRRTLGTLLAALLGSVGLPLLLTLPAAAQPECEWERDANGDMEYVCRGDGSGGGGGDGSSGAGGPTCDLSLVEGLGRENASRFCEGEFACYVNFPSLAYPDPEDWPEEPPTHDSVYTYKGCKHPNGDEHGDWGWYTPDEPTPEMLAWEAYGALQLPVFSLEFSPPQETVVFYDTWWWAYGATGDDLIGTSAGGVVAIAEPSEFRVDPGDGSPILTCPWSTSESDACTYEYNSASDGYEARAQLVYGVRFENNGAPFSMPGLPGSIETPWAGATVPVNEVQSVVTRP